MALKLEWTLTNGGTRAEATCGGRNLVAALMTREKTGPGWWHIDGHPGGEMENGTLLAAQEAAEAALTTLLGGDPGVRALLGLDELRASIEATERRARLAMESRDVTHWRPLGPGPEKSDG